MRIALIIVSVAVAASAAGQCNMTTTALSRAGCYGPGGFTPGSPINWVEINVTNGMPPYTIQWGTFGNNTNTVINNSNPFSVGFAIPTTCLFTPIGPLSNLSYTITDANGCQHSVGPVPLANEGASVMDVGKLTLEVTPGGIGTNVVFKNPQTSCTYGPLMSTFSGSYSNLNYALIRNSVSYGSGVAPVVIGVSDAKLQFNDLPAGDYSLSFSSAFLSTRNWCQSPVLPYSFYLPSSADQGVNVRVAACLAGALPASGSIMNDSLRTQGLVPLTEPYSAAGYTYVGMAPGASISPALLSVTGNTAVVDWVVIEVRSPNSPYAVVASRPALIRRDGEVMDTDGDLHVNFPGLTAGSYRVAVRHRNHLGVMSSSALSLAFLPPRANFRVNASGYGTNPQTVLGGLNCLWPGDCAADGTIRYIGAGNDRDPILVAIGGSTPTSVVSNVYSPLDVNMDGQIRYVGNGNDRDFILTTVGGSTPNNTRTQQLP